VGVASPIPNGIVGSPSLPQAVSAAAAHTAMAAIVKGNALILFFFRVITHANFLLKPNRF
jgi:hypothetical protein